MTLRTVAERGAGCHNRECASCAKRTRDRTDPDPASLAALEARLRRDFELLTLPPAKEQT